MVHSDAIWNDVLEVGTAGKFEIKDAKWWIRTLFKTIFRKLEHLSIFWKQGRKMVHSAAIWNNFYRKLELLKNFESKENKEVAGSEECSSNAYCIYKAELVIQDYLYTKTWQRKQPFMKKSRADVNCKIGCKSLSSVLPFINLYVCIKLNFNPFCTFQRYGQDTHHGPLWKK